MGFVMSLLAGPATGLAGSLLSNLFGGIAGFFKRKQEIEAQKLQQAHEIKLLQLNISARGQEMENEQMIAQTEALSSMLTASYQHDASYGPVSPTVAAVLRFVRPVLTLLLILLTAAIYFTVADGASITIGDDTMTIQQKVTTSVLFMTEMAFSWWFADRRMNMDGK